MSTLKAAPDTAQADVLPATPGRKTTRWAALVLRTWAVDPELCPRCGVVMKRSRPLRDQAELQRLLDNLAIGKYPTRPRSPPPADFDDDFCEEPLADAPTPWPDHSESQVPAGWDEWDAA